MQEPYTCLSKNSWDNLGVAKITKGKTPMPRQVNPRPPLAVRLIQLRHARGLTQVELARAAKLSQRAVAHYETVGKNPPPAVAGRIANALDVTVGELLGHKPIPKNIPILKNRRLLNQLKVLDQLSPKDQKAVLDHLNALAAKTGAGKSRQ